MNKPNQTKANMYWIDTKNTVAIAVMGGDGGREEMGGRWDA